MKDIAAAYRRVGSIRKAGRTISLDGAQHGESQGTRNIAHVGIQVIQTVSRKNLTLLSSPRFYLGRWRNLAVRN